MGVIGNLIVLVTAGAFALAGLEMLGLRSQGGNTVAEFFDNAVGVFSLGMAGLTLAIGIAAERVVAGLRKPEVS